MFLLCFHLLAHFFNSVLSTFLWEGKLKINHILVSVVKAGLGSAMFPLADFLIWTSGMLNVIPSINSGTRSSSLPSTCLSRLSFQQNWLERFMTLSKECALCSARLQGETWLDSERMKWSAYRHTEKLRLSGMGCLMEKPQHSGSSVSLFYIVEHGTSVIAWYKQEGRVIICYWTWGRFS